MQTSSNLGNIEVVKQSENAIEFNMTLDSQYLIEAGSVALYRADGTEIRSHLVWRNGTPLACRVVHGVTDHLLNCVWNLQVFPDDARGCQ